MKNKFKLILKYLPWMLLVAALDIGFCLLFWIADVQSFQILSFTIGICSVLIFVTVVAFVIHKETKYHEAMREFLELPTEVNAQKVMSLCSSADRDFVRILGEQLRKEQYERKQLQLRVIDYEEYVEAWAHEIKTPISLLTLLLDNHSDELPGNIAERMDYIRNRMQEYVEQMLFYARLKNEKSDMYFEHIDLKECVQDVIEDYRPLLEEKHFKVKLQNVDGDVFSDRRGLRFLIAQVVTNSIKYVREEGAPCLEIKYQICEDKGVLSIKDNGIGVKNCDLPYIFDKGFTGASGEKRKKATGMGLYLVQEMARQLKLEVDVESEWMKGFVFLVKFPNV